MMNTTPYSGNPTNGTDRRWLVRQYNRIRRTVQGQILSVLFGVGVCASLLVMVYSTWQSENTGREMLMQDVAFITNLLSENLSLGVQAAPFDDGKSLTESLNLIRTSEKRSTATIVNIRVVDQSLHELAILS
ncbi:MAG: hypothetical protein JNL32_08965, partial [Candidatus Kapabacteria bacterium]|nr:hypothetical protein [Candidatus Kapabacteria bacterium]